jgi:hypothetical protein
VEAIDKISFSSAEEGTKDPAPVDPIAQTQTLKISEEK